MSKRHECKRFGEFIPGVSTCRDTLDIDLWCESCLKREIRCLRFDIESLKDEVRHLKNELSRIEEERFEDFS